MKRQNSVLAGSFPMKPFREQIECPEFTSVCVLVTVVVRISGSSYILPRILTFYE